MVTLEDLGNSELKIHIYADIAKPNHFLQMNIFDIDQSLPRKMKAE